MERSTIRFDPELRPRLLPGAVLLRRSAEELQIGLDPGWRLSDPAGRWQRVLSRLDGQRAWRQIAAELPAVELAELARLFEALAAAGLAELDAGGPGAGCVRLVGVGRLGTSIASRLLQSGVARLYVVESHGTRAERLRQRHPDRIRLVRHWTQPESPVVDLTVIVADRLEADRAVAADLLRHDAPHLVVRPRPAGALIGPLVLPGRTSCLHCTDLVRRDADPAWPRLLGQLMRATAEVGPPFLADWAVGVTVTQVLGHLAGERPDTCGATLESSAPRYAMTWRSWTSHPECGCRWPGSVVSM